MPREEFLRSKLSDIDTSGEGNMYTLMYIVHDKDTKGIHTFVQNTVVKQLIWTCHEAENNHITELYLVCIFNPSGQSTGLYIFSNE